MSQTIPPTPRVIRRMQPWPGNPRVTHLLPFPLRREYRQKSSVHGSPLNGAHTHHGRRGREKKTDLRLTQRKKNSLVRDHFDPSFALSDEEVFGHDARRAAPDCPSSIEQTSTARGLAAVPLKWQQPCGGCRALLKQTFSVSRTEIVTESTAIRTGSIASLA